MAIAVDGSANTSNLVKGITSVRRYAAYRVEQVTPVFIDAEAGLVISRGGVTIMINYPSPAFLRFKLVLY